MSVHLADILMEFPGTRALDRVDVTFRYDEVHGLVGENGAGKSTFVNILSGSLQPTRGTITVNNSAVVFSSPRVALGHGIAHVSQEGSLVPSLTGAENIMLGAEPRRPLGIMRRRALRNEAERLMSTWFPGLEMNLHRPVKDLAMADQKVIEIVRALRGDIRLLVLDEPTATLEAREKKRLWDIIQSLPPKGVGVVLISHFLSEVVALCDRITVLRDGRHVGTLEKGNVTEADLTNLMLRREQDAYSDMSETRSRDDQPSQATIGPVVLSVEDWKIGAVEIDRFVLQRGEIVGLIGLTGAGHFDFARSLYTRQGKLRGTISVNGSEVRAGGIRAMQRAGVALIPDQRMENALSGEGSVVENLTMVHSQFSARGGVLSFRRESQEAARIIDLLNVKTSSQRQLIRNLSGGNKQKVSIGKWLYGADDKYSVLIFIEPTEGVDIGAKMEIYAHLRRLAERGAAILIASSDLGEVAQLCHRAVPFVHGRPGEDIPAAEFSESRFIQAITGDAA